MSWGGHPWPLLVCLGKGNGNRGRCWHGRWRDDVTADWEQLVSDELEATRVPILRKRSSHHSGSVESCRRGSVLFLLLGLLFVGLLLCFRLLWVALLWERGERGQGWVSTDGAHSRPRSDCAAGRLHGASRAEPPCSWEPRHREGRLPVPRPFKGRILLEHGQQALCSTFSFYPLWKHSLTVYDILSHPP